MKYLLKIFSLICLIFAVSQISYSFQQTFEIKTIIDTNYDLLPDTTIPYVDIEFVSKNMLPVKKLPKLNSKNPLYGKISLGNSVTGQSIAVILDEASDEQKRIFIDTNNNGDLTDDGNPFWTNAKEGVLSKQVNLDVGFIDNGANREYSLSYRIYRYENPNTKQIRVVLRAGYLREGKLNLGGRIYKVIAQTFNKAGLFSDPKDITLGIDRDQDGIIDKSLLSAEIFWGGEYGGKPFNIAGETYFIQQSSASGDTLSFAVSNKKVAPKNYVAIGKPAPEFSFRAFNGKNVSLKTLENKVILLDFWATWCAPCVTNLPNLRNVTENFSADDLAVIGISLDGGSTNQITKDQFEKFLSRHKLDWQTSFENQGMESEIASLYNIVDLPLYIVIDRHGTIQMIERGGGQVKMKRIEEKIRTLLEDQM